MPVIRCPMCGNGGEISSLPRNGMLKCRNCGTAFPIRRPRRLPPLLLLIGAMVLVGGGVYLAVRAMTLHLDREETALADGGDSRKVGSTGPAADSSATPKSSADDRRKIEEEERALEAKRRTLQTEKQSLEKEQSQLEQQLKQLRQQKAQLAREQAELRAATERRNPTTTAKIEEIAKVPELHYGQFLYLDGAKVSTKTVEKYKELDRFTVSVYSATGIHYSRVPVAGLFFSITDTIAAALPMHANADGLLSKVRLYCEVRKWERKASPGKSVPEMHIYRIDIFTLTGELAKTLE
jgi:hypothetical protein